MGPAPGGPILKTERKTVVRLWLWRWLRRFNIAPAGFPAAKGRGGRYGPAFEGEHHAPVRASREGPASFIDRIDPDRIVPINT